MLRSRFLTVGLLALTTIARAETPTERLAALPENAWIKLDPKPSKRLLLTERHENSPVKEVTSGEPAFREYTSPHFGDGKLFYFGGGHSGYQGNDMEIYDPAENIWKQCYRPVCPPKDDSTYYSGGSERSFVDPETGAAQPYVIHGYARTGYDPSLRKYVCTAMFPTKIERDATTNKHRIVEQKFSYIGFDEKTNRWESLGIVADELKPGSTSFSFDAGLGSMVAFCDRGVFVFRDRKWTSLGPCDTQLSASGGSGAAYLSDQKAHFVPVLGHGGAKEAGKLFLYHAGDKQPRRIESTPKELAERFAPGTGGYNVIAAYDEANEQLIVMSADAEFRPDVWIYTAATDRWQRLPLSSTAPKLVGVFEPGRGRAPLVYDPRHKVFFLLARRGEAAETWAYRPTSR